MTRLRPGAIAAMALRHRDRHHPGWLLGRRSRLVFAALHRRRCRRTGPGRRRSSRGCVAAATAAARTTLRPGIVCTTRPAPSRISSVRLFAGVFSRYVSVALYRATDGVGGLEQECRGRGCRRFRRLPHDAEIVEDVEAAPVRRDRDRVDSTTRSEIGRHRQVQRQRLPGVAVVVRNVHARARCRHRADRGAPVFADDVRRSPSRRCR